MAKASAPLFERLNQAIQSGEADDVIKTLKVTVFSLSHDLYVYSIHDEARGFWHWKYSYATVVYVACRPCP
jgi:hypothetical protein